MPKRHYPPATTTVAYQRMTAQKAKPVRNSRTKILDPRVYRIEDTNQSRPERDVMIFREYKRGVRLCEEGACMCVCKCHSGPDCIGDAPRVHTSGHKPQQVLIRRDVQCNCPQEGYNHFHLTYCHDADTETRFHFRNPNPAHKRSHR